MTKTSTAVLANIPEGEVVETELTLDGFPAHNPEEPPYPEYEGNGCVRRKLSPNTEHAGIAAELSHHFQGLHGQPESVRGFGEGQPLAVVGRVLVHGGQRRRGG
jgi:hypothetical protein